MADPSVSDPGGNDLIRTSSIVTSAGLRPVRFVPFHADPTGSVNTEVFMFALTRDNALTPGRQARNDRLYFPVNPEEFSWTSSRPTGSYDIINGPQAIQLGNMQARTFTFSSFFPEVYDPEYCHSFPGYAPFNVRLNDGSISTRYHYDSRTAQNCIDWLREAQRIGNPLKFWCFAPQARVSTGGLSILSTVRVYLTNVVSAYRAGNPLDVFFDLEMVEVIEPTIIRTATTTIGPPTWVKKKYTTVRGDSLLDVTTKMYGKNYTSSLWKQIYNANVFVQCWHKPKHAHKHHLQTSKHKVYPATKPATNLLPGQPLVIPEPKAQPR